MDSLADAATALDSDLAAEEPSEIFRELLRHWPQAQVEDYFQNGAWLKDIMLLDVALIKAHRQEARAPEPPPRDEMPQPELPQRAAAGLGRPIAPGPVGPLRSAARGPAGSATRPALSQATNQALAARVASKLQQLAQPVPRTTVSALRRPTSISASASSPSSSQPQLRRPTPPTGPPAAATVAAAGPGAWARLVQHFVDKWGLEPVPTRLALARLAPVRRQYVLDHFRCPEMAADANRELQRFIARCSHDDLWAPVLGKTDSLPAAGRAAHNGSSGVKRPLSPWSSTSTGGAIKRFSSSVVAAGQAAFQKEDQALQAKPLQRSPPLRAQRPAAPVQPGRVTRGTAGASAPSKVSTQSAPPKAAPEEVEDGQPGDLIRRLLGGV